MKKWLTPLFIFVLVLGSSLTCFASTVEDIPPLPSDAQYTTYVVYFIKDGLLQTYATNTHHLSASGDTVYHYAEDGSPFNEQYKLVDGEWVKFGSGSVQYTAQPVCKISELRYSTLDIKRGSEVVFPQSFPQVPQTLPELVLNLGEATLITEAPEVLGTMKILTVCGVGCLALLISSPVLLKVLRRFL